MSIYDNEAGFIPPLEYKELPAVFFEVLRIYREANSVEVKEE